MPETTSIKSAKYVNQQRALGTGKPEAADVSNASRPAAAPAAAPKAPAPAIPDLISGNLAQDPNAVPELDNAFRPVRYTGVFFVVSEAKKLGYYNGNPEWCNIGQGQPESGEMEGAPPRINSVEFDATDCAYGPLGGSEPLRQAVADYYNRLYRQGMAEQYDADNVSLCCGGRMALTRIGCSLDRCNYGYQCPEYTAYEDILWYQMDRGVKPVCLENKEEDGYRMSAAQFEERVKEHDLGAYLFSNPCNPTGVSISGEELRGYVDVAKRNACTLVIDEFYSHYMFNPDGTPGEGAVSAAAHIEDIENTPVLMVDGLTKNFRYPGWRVGWIVGPKAMVEKLNRAASAVDGGLSMPMQKLALKALEPAYADQETNAVREVFSKKRLHCIECLERMGVSVITSRDGPSTPFLWVDVSDLPAPINDGFGFFYEALKYKVVVVPGYFFDVNPKHLRKESRYSTRLRLCFGPDFDNVRLAMSRLETMVNNIKSQCSADSSRSSSDSDSL